MHFDRSDSSIDKEYSVKAPGTLLGLRKVKRFFNLNKKDGALSSQDDRVKSSTDSDYVKSKFRGISRSKIFV